MHYFGRRAHVTSRDGLELYFQRILLRLLKTVVYTYWTLLPTRFLVKSFNKSSYLILRTNQWKDCGTLARWSPNLLPSSLSIWLGCFPSLPCNQMWPCEFWPMECRRKYGKHHLGLAHINLPNLLCSLMLPPAVYCSDLQSRGRATRWEEPGLLNHSLYKMPAVNCYVSKRSTFTDILGLFVTAVRLY